MAYDDTDFIPMDDNDEVNTDAVYPELDAIRATLREGQSGSDDSVEQDEDGSQSIIDGVKHYGKKVLKNLPDSEGVNSSGAIPSSPDGYNDTDYTPQATGKSGRMLQNIGDTLGAIPGKIKDALTPAGNLSDATNATMGAFDPTGEGHNNEDPLEDPKTAGIPKADDAIGQGVAKIGSQMAGGLQDLPFGQRIANYLKNPGDPAAAKAAEDMGPTDGSSSAQKLLGLHQLEQTDPKKAEAALANWKTTMEHQRWAAVAGAEKGDLKYATDHANMAMANFLDGMETKFTPAGNGVTATVMDPHTGERWNFNLTPENFKALMGSTDAQYDHLDNSGVVAALQKYAGQQAQGASSVQAGGQQQTSGQQQPNQDMSIVRGGQGGGALHEALRAAGYDEGFIKQAFALNGYDQKRTADWVKSRIPDMEKNDVQADKIGATQDRTDALREKTAKVAQTALTLATHADYRKRLDVIAKQKDAAGRAAAYLIGKSVDPLGQGLQNKTANDALKMVQPYFKDLQLPVAPDEAYDQSGNPVQPGAQQQRQGRQLPQARDPQQMLQQATALVKSNPAKYGPMFKEWLQAYQRQYGSGG